MRSKMFIPATLKIGFQERQETFTGKLAYIIYYDEKGKLRKETSWEGWRDKKIPSIEISNDPVDGFVLNKGVERYSDWGNSGRSMIRVHDSRGFEFEITVENLLGILMHSDVSKREIDCKCVFAWYGTELVLLPINSEEYQSSITFTNDQSEKLSAKDLVPGRVYKKKKSDDSFVYIGYREFWDIERKHEYTNNSTWPYRNQFRTQVLQTNKGKKHVFQKYHKSYEPYVLTADFDTPSVNTLLPSVSDDIVTDFASRVDRYEHSIHCCSLKKIKFEEIKGSIDIYELFRNTLLHRYIDGEIYSISYKGRLEFSNMYECERSKKPIPVSDSFRYSKQNFPELESNSPDEVNLKDHTDSFIINIVDGEKKFTENVVPIKHEDIHLLYGHYGLKGRTLPEYIVQFLKDEGFKNCTLYLSNGNVVTHGHESIF